MIKWRILFFTLLLLISAAGNSIASVSALLSGIDDPFAVADYQQLTVTGTVSNASTGEPMPGVAIILKGTTIGQFTDLAGKYSINLTTMQAVLQFSFVGFKSLEMTVTAGSVVDVRMETEVTSLEEIIVTGYGVQKKESVVGAIAQVSTNVLVQAGTSNITNAIAGKLSGILTMQQSGKPGSSDSEIIVRGLSSWNGSQPLVLVDGVERDFRSLDPNEINTISVLKDASATAVFGAKGANGVIVVTTRRGTIGKPKLFFTATTGLEIPSRLPEHIDSYTTMSLKNIGHMNSQQFQDLTPDWILSEYKNPSSRINSIRFPDVNWYDILIKPYAPTYQANLNLEGGTKFVRYFTSFGYLHEGSIFEGFNEGYVDTRYKFDRFNYRINLDFAISESTSLSFNLGGDVGIQNTTADNATGVFTDDIDWRTLYGMGPARFPAYFPDWVLEEIPDPNYPDETGMRFADKVGELYYNPYNLLFNGSFNRSLRSKVFTDLILEQKLDFITKGLTLGGKASLSTYYANQSLTCSYSPPVYVIFWDRVGVPGLNPWQRSSEGNETYKMPPINLNVGGMQGGYYTNWYAEGALNYRRVFGKHDVSGLALVNLQQKNSGTEFPFYNAGVVGRITYDYSRRYLLEFNVGYTGSEQFSPENRFGFFPSAAVGWVVSNEKFFRDAVPWMSKLKFRYSDGLVGSDASSSRWLYLSTYSKSGGVIKEGSAANTLAQWEESHKRDLGVEIGLFKNTININVDFFDEYRSKILLPPQTVTFFVGNSFKPLNLGSMKKHGFEVEASYDKILTSKLGYNLRANFGYNENRIIERDDRPYSEEYKKQAGKPYGGQLNGTSVLETGYFTSVNELHIAPSPVGIEAANVGDYMFSDYYPDGLINQSDLHPIKGQLYPPITYSFSGGLNYKGFEINVLFQGNSGKYINYNLTWEHEFVKGAWKLSKSQLDYWSPDNPDANHCTLSFNAADDPKYKWGGGDGNESGYAYMLPGRTWRNGDYLRLKDLYLGYNFNTQQLRRILGINSVLIYFSGNNLLTFTKLLEGDPERANFQTGFFPIMITTRFGMKMAF